MKNVLAIFSLLLVACLAMASLPDTSEAAAEYSIGVSPTIIDLGDVDRGSTRIVKFNVVTPSTEPLLVYLEAQKGPLDFFYTRTIYQRLLANHSEESAESWFEFVKNPTEITPSQEGIQTPGGSIEGWKEVSFLLNIPKEAEAGYHIARVMPNPTTPSEQLGPAGARVVAVTAITILFNVRGAAIRDGRILDVTPGNTMGSRMEVNTHFLNTGTVTLSAKADQVLERRGIQVANLTSAYETLGPGETKMLKTYIPSALLPSKEDIEKGGEWFSVSTNVSFTTGSVSRISSLSLEAMPAAAVQPASFPWTIVLVIIVICVLSLAIYKWPR